MTKKEKKRILSGPGLEVVFFNFYSYLLVPPCSKDFQFDGEAPVSGEMPLPPGSPSLRGDSPAPGESPGPTPVDQLNGMEGLLWLLKHLLLPWPWLPFSSQETSPVPSLLSMSTLDLFPLSACPWSAEVTVCPSLPPVSPRASYACPEGRGCLLRALSPQTLRPPLS